MREEEKQLFFELCKCCNGKPERGSLVYATPYVLGHLFFNRMQGIAYDTLSRNGMLEFANREFRNSLKNAYEQNMQKNQSYFQCVKWMAELLASCKCKVAMLKGAYLCAYYPAGCRTSNDIDLLLLDQDVTVVGNLLRANGFVQGNIRSGKLIPATREEIIAAKMMRGETVPFIKKVDLPGMMYLEVDINFSMDYKNGEKDVISKILEKSSAKEIKGISIPTLCTEDFFIHLCAHLYKEATTLPWIEMHRDMSLYKYSDIYVLLNSMKDDEVEKVFSRAESLGLVKVCAYAILETADLFDVKEGMAVQLSKRILQKDPFFCLTVVAPKEKRTWRYQTSKASARFFLESRILDLKEVEK